MPETATRIKCKYCGAFLSYKETKIGRFAKCDYCRAEYHVDELGRLTDYKVKLLVQGVVKEFYVGCVEVHPIINNVHRTIDGKAYPISPVYKTKINLIEI